MLQSKCALVLGNSEYAGDLRLGSPALDAAGVAAALTHLRFDVSMRINVEYDRATELIDEFTEKLEKLRPYVTVVYYSGHGIQIDEENFIVPIDFGAQQNIRLLSVQSIIDRVAPWTTLQVVLLDACRSNFDAQAAIRSKGVPLGGRQLEAFREALTGLAEMKAPSSTFIAFAAAPGAVAFDGETLLSPFTDALVKNITAVDLPLSNLMSRVRQEVFLKTKQQQRTWDHSSLMAPFYFNPGSMFMFMGNAMAVVGILLSFIPYSFILSSPEVTWVQISFALCFPLLSFCILLYGTQTVYARLRGAYPETQKSVLSLWRIGVDCLKRATISGYLGALASAAIFTPLYYRSWLIEYNDWLSKSFRDVQADVMLPPEPIGEIMAKITVGTAVSGCVLGFLTLFCARISVARWRLHIASFLSEISLLRRAIVGGVLSGILCAPALTLYFQHEAGPIALPQLLVPSGIVGAALFVFAIVNFDFERLSARRILVGLASTLSAMAIGGAGAAVVFGPLYAFGFVDLVVAWVTQKPNNVFIASTGALLEGVSVGLVLGLVIGMASVLAAKWDANASMTTTTEST